MRTPFTLALLLALMLPMAAWAGGASLTVDAQFDRTGDGIVDAADWAKMSEEDKRAYADASVEVLGEDPEAILVGKQSRGERYLQGLRAVYE